MNIIKTICKERNIRLIDVTLLSKKEFKNLIDNTTGRKKDFIENSYICGKEIVLGIYDDKDKRMASFFHELGHLLIHKKYKKYPEGMKKLHWEIECWNCGIYYAFKRFGIIFKEDTIKWAYEEALSYYHYA